MDEQVASGELWRHGVGGAEVHHVERPQADDLRQADPPGHLQPPRPRGQDTTHEVVGQLGGGEVAHPGQQARLGEFLHGSATRPGGVEDQHLVAEVGQGVAGLVRGRGRHAEHGDRDDRFVAGGDGGQPVLVCLAIPAIAAAALANTWEETELMPATSTTEYMSVASTSPT